VRTENFDFDDNAPLDTFLAQRALQIHETALRLLEQDRLELATSQPASNGPSGSFGFPVEPEVPALGSANPFVTSRTPPLAVPVSEEQIQALVNPPLAVLVSEVRTQPPAVYSQPDGETATQWAVNSLGMPPLTLPPNAVLGRDGAGDKVKIVRISDRNARNPAGQ
jgi:hypothetical protein